LPPGLVDPEQLPSLIAMRREITLFQMSAEVSGVALALSEPWQACVSGGRAASVTPSAGIGNAEAAVSRHPHSLPSTCLPATAGAAWGPQRGRRPVTPSHLGFQSADVSRVWPPLAACMHPASKKRLRPAESES